MTEQSLSRKKSRHIVDERRAKSGDESLHQIFDNMSEGCQILCHDWKYIYINEVAARHGKKTRKELLGKTIMECYPGFENTKMFAVMRRAMDRRVFSELLNEFTYPNGTKGWFEIRVEPVPEGILVFSIDVTERLRKQKQAERQRARLAKDNEALSKLKVAINSASDAIIVTDAEKNIVYANASCEAITGYNIDTLLGKNIDIIWGTPTLPSIYERMWSICKSKGKFNGLLRNTRKDGRPYDAHIMLSPVIDKNGKTEFYIAIEHDMTPEEELDRIKGDLVSLVAHQLRTTPNIISWSIESLLSKEKSVSRSERKLLTNMSQANRRMIMIIDTMLNISRTELGTLVINPEIVNITNMINGELDEQQKITKNKNIKVEKEYPSTPCSIRSDDSMLHIIFHNIISNAIKYTPNGGKVSIKLEPRANVLDARITDTGCGIPKSDQALVFTKLFRADNARIIDPNGNGLGLYLTKLLVENLHGSIRFVSKENKGTTFHVRLPVKGVHKREGTTNLVETSREPKLKFLAGLEGRYS